MLVLALFSGAAGAQPPAAPDHPVARVNGRLIHASAVREIVKNVVAASEHIPSSEELKRLYESALRSLIDHELLVEEARRRGITVSVEEVEGAVRETRDRFGNEESFARALDRSGLSPEQLRAETERALLAKKLLEQVVWADVRVNENEVRQFFQQHRQELGDETSSLDFEQLAPAIRRVLLERKRQERQEEFLTDLRRRARIERLDPIAGDARPPQTSPELSGPQGQGPAAPASSRR